MRHELGAHGIDVVLGHVRGETPDRTTVVSMRYLAAGFLCLLGCLIDLILWRVLLSLSAEFEALDNGP